MTTSKTDIEEIAEMFGHNMDPLESYEVAFQELDTDVFEYYVNSLGEFPYTEKTLRHYELSYGQWKTFMVEQERHPACPNNQLVQDFVKYLIEEEGNKPQTALKKLYPLRRVFEFMQIRAAFPHPVTFDPVQQAIQALRSARKQDFINDNE